MHLYHMLVREKNLVCWENRCSLLWDFTSRNLVDSPVMSTVSFEDSADINAGIEDAKPRSSLYYDITLQWEVYIEKTFTDFPLLLQLFDWTRGQSFAARNYPSRCWLLSDVDKCLLPHGSSSDGHRMAAACCAGGSAWRFMLCTSVDQLLMMEKCPNLSDITTSPQVFCSWICV